MRKWIFAGFFLGVSFFVLTGCQEQQRSADFKGPLLLSVDFQSGVALRYKFVSERQIELAFESSGKDARKSGRNQTYNEKLEMEISYNPTEIDPYGYSVIEAVCDSVKVTRSSRDGRGHNKSDAVESAVGRSFTIKITPTGKIVDYTSLENLVKELGGKSFTQTSNSGRVKDPDMIMDFIATQWHLWDAVSSVKNPLKGLKKGHKWKSQMLAPMPFVSKKGRDVEYTFAGTVDVNGVSLAEITSSYTLSGLSPEGIPMPYTGSFQMRGTFGFLRGYQVNSLTGRGRLFYDIERGLIQSDVQQYHTEAAASVFGLATANLSIDQTITMTLME
ncbi:MAG: hypothetical protein JW806_01775 [Sedimentisphaerales bacterium]|nr:hypothetical protein [Sedimentisphaerales bacterium]